MDGAGMELGVLMTWVVGRKGGWCGLGGWERERERERKKAGRRGWDGYGRGKGAEVEIGKKENEAARGVVPRRVRCSWLGKWGSNCFFELPMGYLWWRWLGLEKVQWWV